MGDVNILATLRTQHRCNDGSSREWGSAADTASADWTAVNPAAKDIAISTARRTRRADRAGIGGREQRSLRAYPSRLALLGVDLPTDGLEHEIRTIRPGTESPADPGDAFLSLEVLHFFHGGVPAGYAWRAT